MAELKTKATSGSVTEFMDTIEPTEKRADDFALADVDQTVLTKLIEKSYQYMKKTNK